MRAALDFEFGFNAREFDFAGVVIICGVLLFEDGRRIVVTPKTGFEDLRPHLENPEIRIVMHHADAERRCLKHLGLPFPASWDDTELAERVISITNYCGLAYDRYFQEIGPYSLLNVRARRGLSVRSSIAKAAMQEKCGRLEFTPADMFDIIKYCADDCAETLELAQVQAADFEQFSDRARGFYEGIIKPYHLRVMECSERGFCFDFKSYFKIQDHGEELLTKLQRELKFDYCFTGQFEFLGERLTVPRLNADVLKTFYIHGLYDLVESLPVFSMDTEKPAQYQRRKLSGLFRDVGLDDPPIIRRIGEYHSCADLIKRDWSNFIDSDHRIRPGCVFPGASSYRAQQFKPHPLQLPMFARPLVHAKAGHVLLQVDYKAQEVGLSAAIFGDTDLLDAFNNFSEDLYWEIGQRMGECPSGSMKSHKSKRDAVKTCVLAIMYGGGVPAIMANLRCPFHRAIEFLSRFKATFPKLYKGRKNYIENCRATRIALNPFGLERKWTPVLFKSDGAVRSDLSYLNFPVQSAGSCILMRVLSDLPNYLQPILLMHDALLFEVPEDSAVDAAKEASAIMKTGAEDLFPELKIRTEAQAAFRFHKDSPASLHEFCAGLGVTLTEPVGASVKGI